MAVTGVNSASVVMGNAGDSSLAQTTVQMDGRDLTRGKSYSVCLDVDGETNFRAMGDTSLKVYINAIEAVVEKAVRKTTGQVLTLTCPNECVAGTTSLYLGTTCDLTETSGNKTAVTNVNTNSETIVSTGGDGYTVQVSRGSITSIAPR